MKNFIDPCNHMYDLGKIGVLSLGGISVNSVVTEVTSTNSVITGVASGEIGVLDSAMSSPWISSLETVFRFFHLVNEFFRAINGNYE